MPLSQKLAAAVRALKPDVEAIESLFNEPLDKAQWKEVLELRKAVLLKSRAGKATGRKIHIMEGVCWAKEVRVLRVEPKRSKRLGEYDARATKTLLFQDGKGWWQDPLLFYLSRIQHRVPFPARLTTGSVLPGQDFEALKAKIQEYKAEACAYYEPFGTDGQGLVHSERSQWAETLIFACDSLLEGLDRWSKKMKASSHIVREAELVGYARAFLEASRDPRKLELNKKAAAFMRSENPLRPLIRSRLAELLKKRHQLPKLIEFRKMIGCRVLSGKGRDKKIQIEGKTYKDSFLVDGFKDEVKLINKRRS